MNRSSNSAAHILRVTDGFTLLELSIVLVIIGLLVGGVLIGKDMITSASVRSQVSQIDRYDAAVHTFRLKYTCLPGDCANGANYGLEARLGTYGRGDGNGYITPRTGYTPTGYQMNELLGFWNDLARAGLINDPIDTSNASQLDTCPYTLADAAKCFPKCKVGGGNCLVAVYSSPTSYQTFYFLAQPSGSLQFSAWPTAAVTPAEAYGMDSKMDDGMPSSGRQTLISPGAASLDTDDTTGAAKCLTSATAYNVSSTYANQALCVPRIRVRF